MRKTILTLVPVIGLLLPVMASAQGALYVSNLGASVGSIAVGSNSWLAAGFATGINADGYALNSVQLVMTDASGNPNGFTVMLFAQNPYAILPGNSLGTLNGSADPATAGIYTYTPRLKYHIIPGHGLFYCADRRDRGSQWRF